MDRPAFSTDNKRLHRRHMSSVFEMNTDSLLLTDILEALKTEQVDTDTVEDSRKQTV
jgi:hypothetical protein